MLMETTPLGRSTGKGRRSSASARLKIALLAPMPMASESAAIAVNPGFLANRRKAWRISCSICLKNTQSGRHSSLILKRLGVQWFTWPAAVSLSMLCAEDAPRFRDRRHII